MRTLINQERVTNGLSPLSTSTELNSAAIVRANEIVNTFGHVRPDGSNFNTVLDQNNITYLAAGENIAAGQTSPKAVMTS